LGSFINDDNAQGLFTAWQGAIENYTLRLKLILEQAAGSGLTPIIIIKKAIQIFPKFDWAKFNRKFPGDMENSRVAAEAIGANRYYG
jgi:hypothetical protein